MAGIELFKRFRREGGHELSEGPPTGVDAKQLARGVGAGPTVPMTRWPIETLDEGEPDKDQCKTEKVGQKKRRRWDRLGPRRR